MKNIVLMLLLAGFLAACTPGAHDMTQSGHGHGPAPMQGEEEMGEHQGGQPLGMVGNIGMGQGWVRATPPGTANTGAFLHIHNRGDQGDELIGASSPIARTVELHNVRMNDGMMQMYPVEGIEIPANEMVELKPGSFHIMLIGLNAFPQPGDMVEITLTYRHSGSVTLMFPVQEMAPMHDMTH